MDCERCGKQSTPLSCYRRIGEQGFLWNDVCEFCRDVMKLEDWEASVLEELKENYAIDQT